MPTQQQNLKQCLDIGIIMSYNANGTAKEMIIMTSQDKASILETIKQLPEKDKAFIYGWAAGRLCDKNDGKKKPA